MHLIFGVYFWISKCATFTMSFKICIHCFKIGILSPPQLFPCFCFQVFADGLTWWNIWSVAFTMPFCVVCALLAFFFWLCNCLSLAVCQQWHLAAASPPLQLLPLRPFSSRCLQVLPRMHFISVCVCVCQQTYQYIFYTPSLSSGIVRPAVLHCCIIPWPQ